MKKIFTDTLLDQARTIGDPLADKVVDELMLAVPREEVAVLMRFLASDQTDIPTHFPKILQAYFQQNLLPAYTDENKIKNGIAFFQKHQQDILQLLGLVSLPYCYAAAKGVQVLFLSERIQKDTYNRLQETASFVQQILNYRTFEEGKASIVIGKVRLLHAIIRYFTYKNPQWNPDWGVPINQEDMAGTNLAFSYIVVRAMRQLQKDFSKEDDFLYIWKIIGFGLGLEEALLPDNFQQAYWLDKKIAQRQFAPSKEGQLLMQALLKIFDKYQPAWSKPFILAQMRFLLGKNVSRILQV